MSYFNNPLTTNTVTRPWYLLHLRLGFNDLYLSTGAQADWDGVTYLSGIVSRDSPPSIDSTHLRVAIDNSDRRHSVPALRGEYRGGLVRAWSVPVPGNLNQYLQPGYVDPGYEEATDINDPVLVFEGEISDITRIDIEMEITATRIKLGGFPRLRVNTPLANFTAQPGTVLTMNGRIYTVVQRSYGRG